MLCAGTSNPINHFCGDKTTTHSISQNQDNNQHNSQLHLSPAMHFILTLLQWQLVMTGKPHALGSVLLLRPDNLSPSFLFPLIWFFFRLFGYLIECCVSSSFFFFFFFQLPFTLNLIFLYCSTYLKWKLKGNRKKMNLDFILIKCIKNRKKKLQATDKFFSKKYQLNAELISRATCIRTRILSIVFIINNRWKFYMEV